VVHRTGRRVLQTTLPHIGSDRWRGLRIHAGMRNTPRTRTLSIAWLANDARLRNSKPSLVEDTCSTLGLYCSSSSRIEPSLFNQGTRERAQTWTLGSSWLRWRTVPTRTA